MFTPIFETISEASAVTDLIGADTVRFYPAGEAPEGVERPYATYQHISGLPENYINQRPDMDSHTVQVDIWASTLTSARNVATAIRDAVEPHAYITRWGGESRDTETKSYRISFDVDWHVPR